MNITHYNNSLLKDRKTLTLHHAHEYDTMQTQIQSIIEEVNKHILCFNENRGLATPMCHFAIVRRHGKGNRGYYKHHWEGLYDGLHATDTTKERWAKAIRIAISTNRDTVTHHTHGHTNAHNKTCQTRQMMNIIHQRGHGGKRGTICK